MTLKDIAVTAAVILQADDIEYVLTEGDKSELSSDSDAKCMLLSANLAVKEACADGFPILREITATAENKRIPLSEVPSADAVKSVMLGGKRCSFSVDSLGVSVPKDGVYTVIYAETPRDFEPDDEVTLGAFADRSMLAYLTARDYCLMTGRTDEAAIWDQRYVSESEKKRLGRRAHLPGRPWI